jgi:hypothetical protein
LVVPIERGLRDCAIVKNAGGLPVRVDGLRRMSLYTEDHKEKAGRGSKEDSPPISSTL